MSKEKDIVELKAKAYDLGVKLRMLQVQANIIVEQIKKANVEVVKAENTK